MQRKKEISKKKPWSKKYFTIDHKNIFKLIRDI